MARNERLLGVQYLRGAAALMVAYFHLTLQLPAYTPYLASESWIDTRYFAEAVPVFFVISGFVMYVSGIQSSPGRFAWRRLVRIVPLYWVLTLAIIALAVLRPGLLHTQLSGEFALKSLLFVPYFPGRAHEIFPILGPGWSLDYEMFFYAIFALALLAPLRWRLPTMLLTLAGLYAIGAAEPTVRENALGLAYTSGLLGLFAIGLVLGWVYRNGKFVLPKCLSVTLIGGGFWLLVSTATAGWLHEDIAPAAIVVGVVGLDAGPLCPPGRGC